MLVSDIMKQLNESCSSSGEASKCETSNASAQNVLLEVEVENLRKEGGQKVKRVISKRNVFDNGLER